MRRMILLVAGLAVLVAGCESREKKLSRLRLEAASATAGILRFQRGGTVEGRDSVRAYELRLEDINAEIDEILRQR